MTKGWEVLRAQASTGLGTSRGAFFVFAVALVFRLLFVSLTTITPISDAERYAGHAERLLDGRGFTSDEGEPTAYTPPGYPFFVAGVQAALGRDARTIAYVQAVLGAVCCAFTFLVCHRLFDRRRALTAGLLLAVSPTAIAYSGTLLSEIPATLAILAVLMVLVADDEESRGRRLRALFAGLLLGVGMLIRPAIVGYALGLGAWLLLFHPGTRSGRLFTAGALVAGVVVVIGPWTYRNYRVMHSFVPVSNNGDYVLYVGNNPRAHGGGWMFLEHEIQLHRDERQGALEARRRALAWIRQNPIAYAKLTLRRALTWISVAPDHVPSLVLTSTAQIDEMVARGFRETWSTGREPQDPPELQRSKRINSSILIAWSLLTIPFAVVGMLLDAANRPRWLLLLPVITYASALSLTFMEARFREVVMPILLMYTAVGLSDLGHLGPSRQRPSSAPRRALLLGLLPLALLFCFQLFRDWHIIGSGVGWSQAVERE
jgi:4-amino-4-deoxy-L-arabinose transferase-like glycosyltransferase